MSGINLTLLGTTFSSALYTFTSHTFTSAGITGSSGPTLTNVQSAYISQSWAQNTAFLNVTTQGIQNWTVPADGIYEFDIAGAQGGSGTKTGGNGGRVIGRITLTKGEVIYILVGQAANAATGGWGGGGTGDVGGGGASDVRRNGMTLAERILVGGGGGGSSNYSATYDISPGVGGYPSGTGTIAGSNGTYTRYSGGGGTQSAGGAAGTGNYPGNAGSLGVGGNKGTQYGGGGGGGYYGGGGGGYETGGANFANGGGGGSSYYNSSLISSVSTTSGYRTGNGYVSVTFIG